MGAEQVRDYGVTMRIGIVTPVRNGADFIESTIASLLDQTAVRTGRVHLFYVVQDGASTDATVERAQTALAAAPANVTWRVTSEPDIGMYDALARGFSAIAELAGDDRPDWYAYLNAGDLYAATAFATIADVAEQTDITWLCGLHAYFNAHGTLVHTRLPAGFKRDLIRAGAYGRGLPTIQQESTFWARSLHDTIDFAKLATFRLAGDAYLWWTFAARQEPAVIQALLGGFTYHGGHLGTSKREYQAEIGQFAGPITMGTKTKIAGQLALWEQPARVKARLNQRLLLHSTATGAWATTHWRVVPTT